MCPVHGLAYNEDAYQIGRSAGRSVAPLPSNPAPVLRPRIYSENANGLTKLVVKYIPNRGISLSNPYRNHHLHSQLIFDFKICGVI